MALSEKQIQTVRQRRKEMGRPRGRRAKRWLPPMGVAREMSRLFRSYIDEFIKLSEEQIEPRLEGLITDAGFLREDSMRADSWERDLAALILATEATFNDVKPREQDLAMALATETESFNKKEFNKVIESVLGVDLFVQEPFLTEARNAQIAKTVDLIETVPERFKADIESVVKDNIRKGATAGDLSKQLQARYNVSRFNAERIGRDQVLSYNAELTKERQKNVGLTRYRWRTAGDERVRDEEHASHVSLEGKIFSWDNPPAEGNPGEPVQCRCWAEVLEEDLLAQIEE